MIVVRDVFRIRPGQGEHAESILRQLLEHETRAGVGPGRIMIDRTSTHFPHLADDERFIVEREFPTFAVFKEREHLANEDHEIRRTWTACKGVVHNVKREILETLV